MFLGVHVAKKKVLKEEQLRIRKTVLNPDPVFLIRTVQKNRIRTVQRHAPPELPRQTSNEHMKPTTNEKLFVHDKHVFLGERFRDDIITIDRSPALEAA